MGEIADEFKAILAIIHDEDPTGFLESSRRIVALRCNAEIAMEIRGRTDELIAIWSKAWHRLGNEMLNAMALAKGDDERLAWTSPVPDQALLSMIASQVLGLMLRAARLLIENRDLLEQHKPGSVGVVMATWNMTWLAMGRRVVEQMNAAAPGVPVPELFRSPPPVKIGPPDRSRLRERPETRGKGPITEKALAEFVQTLAADDGEAFMDDTVRHLANGMRLVWWDWDRPDASAQLAALYETGKIGPRPWDPNRAPWLRGFIFDVILLYLALTGGATTTQVMQHLWKVGYWATKKPKTHMIYRVMGVVLSDMMFMGYVVRRDQIQSCTEKGLDAARKQIMYFWEQVA